MHTRTLDDWTHAHRFGDADTGARERRVLWVIGLTAATMVAEIAGGIAFGSMALLADGLHMASHVTALAITAFAYAFARRHADDPRFSFGTGKVGSLAGFASAVLLAGFAGVMAVESVGRLMAPREIVFDQALVVAAVGLAVNAVSAVLLRGGHGHGHHHDHDDDHDHDHDHGTHDDDHNLHGAYLHVIADALTSVLAILALLAGKLAGWVWLDPLMGIVGALLIAHWSWGLLRRTGAVLTDRQAPLPVCRAITDAIEGDGTDRVADLHVWSIGPGSRAAILSVVTDDPQAPAHYRERLPDDLGLAHVSIEVHRCPNHHGGVP